MEKEGSDEPPFKRRKIVIDLTDSDEKEGEALIEEPSGSESDADGAPPMPAHESSDDDDGNEDDFETGEPTHADEVQPILVSDDDEPDVPDPPEPPDEKDVAAQRASIHNQDAKVNLFNAVRAPGPKSLTAKQHESVELAIDMAEHSFDLEVLEIIRLGDHVLKHGYDCCHPDCSPPSSSVFKCSDCGLVAETKARVWDDSADLASKAPRLAALIKIFIDKTIDPKF